MAAETHILTSIKQVKLILVHIWNCVLHLMKMLLFWKALANKYWSQLDNAIPEEIASGNAFCWKADAELLC